jgi:serine/threonine protein kinase
MSVQLKPGLTIKKYTLEHCLGSGATGEVWAASNGSKTVAMKFIHQRHLESDAAAKHRQRLQNEINILAHLQHPHIPTLYDHDQDFERPFLVMRYIAEAPYEDLITTGEMLKIRLEKRLAALKTLAQTLAFVHTESIIHRDIKPGSINGIDTPYLLDFGISIEAQNIPNAQEDVGTGIYMPPQNVPLGKSIDDYGFAVVAYEVIFGCHPIFARHTIGKTLMDNRRLTGERLETRSWRFPSSIPLSECPGDLGGVEFGLLDELFENALCLNYPQPTAFVDDLFTAIVTPQNRPFLDNPPTTFPVFSLPVEEHYTDDGVARENRDTDTGVESPANFHSYWQNNGLIFALFIIASIIVFSMIIVLVNN